MLHDKNTVNIHLDYKAFFTQHTYAFLGAARNATKVERFTRDKTKARRGDISTPIQFR